MTDRTPRGPVGRPWLGRRRRRRRRGGSPRDDPAAHENPTKAFAQGDAPTVVAAMDEDIEWYEAEGGPWCPGHAFVGPQQVVENVFARLVQEFEDFRIDCRRFLADGDTVVVEARYSATRHRATGKALDVQVAHVWELRIRKLIRFQQYVDPRRLADVMGASAY